MIDTLIKLDFQLTIAGQSIGDAGILSSESYSSIDETGGYFRAELAAERFSTAIEVNENDSVYFEAGYAGSELAAIFSGGAERPESSKISTVTASSVRALDAIKIKESWRNIPPARIVQYLCEAAGMDIAELDLPARLAKHIVSDNKTPLDTLAKIRRLYKIDYPWHVDVDGNFWWVPEGHRISQREIPLFQYGIDIVEFSLAADGDHRLTLPQYPYLIAGWEFDLVHPLLVGRMRVKTIRQRRDEFESWTEIILNE